MAEIDRIPIVYDEDGSRRVIGFATRGGKGEIEFEVHLTDPEIIQVIGDETYFVVSPEPKRLCEWDENGEPRVNYNICVAEGCFNEACLRKNKE